MSRRIPDSEVDWISIEGRYRAGASARSLAEETGISHTRILRRAQRWGWLQDPTGTKRERVKAALLGSPGVAEADQVLDRETDSDVRDMNLGLDNARLILRRISRQLQDGVLVAVDADGKEVRAEVCPKDLRTLGSANLAAIETVRRVRGLDEPGRVGAGIYTKEERDAIVQAAIGPG